MITFAAITPHPPIIIPGIGRPEDLKLVSKTISAMENLGKKLEKAKPDTILLISPHAPTDYSTFVINSSPKLVGSFVDFGYDKDFEFKNNLDLVEEIAARANEKDIPVHFHEGFLDHGALVPLYYLTKNVKPKLVELSFSFLDFKKHYAYGEMIGDILAKVKQNIAVVASGDMSHRLMPGAPAGYSPRGKEFDEKLIDLLSENDVNGILNLDLNFVEEAGECGLRSIIILLGILKGNFNFNLINYEGPFGVGYLTASLTP